MVNTTAAYHSKPPLIDIHDISCQTSYPNALFGSWSSGKEAQSWPRLSLRDLDAGHDLPAAKENASFNVISLTMSPVGFVPGAELEYIGVEITVNFLRMPKASSVPLSTSSQITLPGFVPGEPIRDRNLTFSVLTVRYSAGWHRSLPIYLREHFGPDFASGVDVIEIYGQALKTNEAGGVVYGEDWPFCIDDVLLELVEGENVHNGIGEEQGKSVTGWEKTICYDDTTCYTGQLLERSE